MKMEQKMADLERVADQVQRLVNASVDHWRDAPDQLLTLRTSAEAWSVKEIIGHMIDSAANNHQRFIRLQLADRLTFPDYQQDNENWVRIQRYQERPWIELLGLWRHFNDHLSHLIRSVDPSCLNHVWVVDTEVKGTLFELMSDYLRHLEVHLDQIAGILESSI
jgi:hypothetical protein